MRKPTALGVFIFAGGFTTGVKKHFNVLAQLEDGPFGVETTRLNHPRLEVVQRVDDWDVGRFRGVDFLFSNPPCAAWSRAGAKNSTNWEKDSRPKWTERVFNLIPEVKPQVWAWESVRGAFTFGRTFTTKLTARALDLGYHVTHLYVEGSTLGLAQRRARYFMLVHKVELDFTPPRLAPLTVRDVLRGVTRGPGAALGGNEWVKILGRVKPGEEVRKIFNKRYKRRVERADGGKVVGRPSFQVKRAHWDRLCWTLTGGAQILHPTSNRYLTVNEYAALCGYPAGYEFIGTVHQQYAQVAKAVTPPVAAYLARHVAAAVCRKRSVKPGIDFVEVLSDEVVEVALTLDELPTFQPAMAAALAGRSIGRMSA